MVKNVCDDESSLGEKSPVAISPSNSDVFPSNSSCGLHGGRSAMRDCRTESFSDQSLPGIECQESVESEFKDTPGDARDRKSPVFILGQASSKTDDQRIHENSCEPSATGIQTDSNGYTSAVKLDHPLSEEYRNDTDQNVCSPDFKVISEVNHNNHDKEEVYNNNMSEFNKEASLNQLESKLASSISLDVRQIKLEDDQTKNDHSDSSGLKRKTEKSFEDIPLGGDSPYAVVQTPGFITTPSDIGEHSSDEKNVDTKCGTGPCKPACLQSCAKPTTFLIGISLLVLVQSMLVSGYTSGIITTIERRFDLSSTEAGVVISSYEFTCMFATVFISYFGDKYNRAKLIGRGAIFIAIGAVIFTLPHFLGGTYEVKSSNNTQVRE